MPLGSHLLPAIVLPVFGLIGVGYTARQIGLVSDATGEGLSDFVFTLAVPCLIFRTLARAEMPAVQPWGYWIAYFAGVAIVWALASLAAGGSSASAAPRRWSPVLPPGRRTPSWSASR